MKRAVRDIRVLQRLALFRDTEKCIFCGGAPTTKEHVFSHWIHQSLLLDPPRIKFRVQMAYYNRIISAEFSRPPMRHWQIKCVCKKCNGGWMSNEVENDHKQLLTDLFEGSKRTLGDAEKRAIATWAILKCMVTHNKLMPRPERRFMYQHKSPPPDTWGVWIGSYDRITWREEWKATPFPTQFGSTLTRRATPPNAFATTQVIKKLFVHTVYCPFGSLVDGWRFSQSRCRPLSGNLIKIWPPTDRRIFWPQKSLSDCDAETATYAIGRAVDRWLKAQGVVTRTDGL
jgi:hypothetical protein